MLVLVCVLTALTNLCTAVAASQCSLLSHCTVPRRVSVGVDEAIVWGVNNPDGTNLPVFYHVPDGGPYNFSHMISDNDPGYNMSATSLELINVSSRHEGKYYCVQRGGEEVTPISSPCIIVEGNPTLSCGSRETCTETVHILSNEDVFLNTSLSFVNGGRCHTVQYIQLVYNDSVKWNSEQASEEGGIQLYQSFDSKTDEHRFNLNIGHVTGNNCGLYRVIVGLKDNNFLEKYFNLTVMQDNSSSVVTMEPEHTETEPISSSPTSARHTTPTTDSSSQQMGFQEKHIYYVVLAIIGLCLLVIMLAVIIVVIATRRYRRNVTIKSQVRTFDKTSIYGDFEGDLFLDDFLNSHLAAHV